MIFVKISALTTLVVAAIATWKTYRLTLTRENFALLCLCAGLALSGFVTVISVLTPHINEKPIYNVYDFFVMLFVGYVLIKDKNRCKGG